MRTFRYLKTRKTGHTLWVEIYNPRVNFIVTDMLEELFLLIKDVEKDDSIRVFVMTGGLADIYIMHFSIPELQRISEDNEKVFLNRMVKNRVSRFFLVHMLNFTGWLMDASAWYESATLKMAKSFREKVPSLFLWLQMTRLYLAIERMNKITIAAINGPCNGGGVEISLCFDFRFMVGDQGFAIGQPECLIGIIPGGGGTQRLPRLIGRPKALEWMMRGNLLSPEEAKQIGLITDYFNKETFRDTVQEFADLMGKRPPVAIDAIKKSVHEGMNGTLGKGLVLEMVQSIRCFDTDDAKTVIKNYIKLIEEKVDVPEEERMSPAELFDIMEHARLVERFYGK